VTRPVDSFLPNIHFYNVGIGKIDGQTNIRFMSGKPSDVIKIATLKTLMKEYGDYGKNITYLKMDVEGTEIRAQVNWLKTG
jgi:hypothetical protein